MVCYGKSTLATASNGTVDDDSCRACLRAGWEAGAAMMGVEGRLRELGRGSRARSGAVVESM